MGSAAPASGFIASPSPTGGSQSACLAGEAVGVLVGQLKAQLFANELHRLDRVPADRTCFIFDFHLEVLGGQELGGKVQYIRNPTGRQAMVWVNFRDPGLEQAGLNPPDRATAINRSLCHVADLGNVESGRNRISIGENEKDLVRRIPLEACPEE